LAEVITVERRRRWSDADKLRIVTESREAGGSASTVAARYGLHSSQVFAWRKAAREGRLGDPAIGFAPVLIGAAASEPDKASPAGAASSDRTGRIEIELERGRVIVAGSVDAAVLRCVLEALAGR
jgi:transposase